MIARRPSRNPGTDIARAIGMVLVVYGHALEMSFLGRPGALGAAFAQWQFLYSFHMPLFFLISGMVFRVRSTRDAVSNTLFLLLVSYAVHALGWFGMRGQGDPGASLQTLLFPVLNGYGFYTSVVWFLVALALVQLSYHGMARSGAVGRAAIALLLAASFVVATVTGSHRFQLGALLPGVLFYAIGHWLARSGAVEKAARFRPLLIAGAAAATAFLAPLNGGCLFDATGQCGHEALHGAFAVWMAFGAIGFVPAFVVTALLGSLTVLWIADAVANRGGAVAASLSRLGARTLDLLIVNGLVLQFVQPSLKRLIADDAPASLGIAWALALTVAQLLLLPVLGLVTGPALTLAKRVAQRLAGIPARPDGPERNRWRRS